MAAGNVARIIRAPGTLVANPTAAFSSGTPPYGGAVLGLVRAFVLLPLGRGYTVWYEGLGEPGDLLEASNEYVAACFLRGWDDDAVEQCFAGQYEEGAETKHAVFYEPGTAVPGASTLARAIKVAYVPDNPEEVPGVLLYRAVPEFQEGAEVAFQREEELGLPVVFQCIRDGSGRILRAGRLADLSL